MWRDVRPLLRDVAADTMVASPAVGTAVRATAMSTAAPRKSCIIE